jgi:hypothetical protein
MNPAISHECGAKLCYADDVVNLKCFGRKANTQSYTGDSRDCDYRDGRLSGRDAVYSGRYEPEVLYEFSSSIVLVKKGVDSSETSVFIYRTARYLILVGNNLKNIIHEGIGD